MTITRRHVATATATVVVAVAMGVSCTSAESTEAAGEDPIDGESDVGDLRSDAPVLDAARPVGDVWLASGASPSAMLSAVSHAIEPNSVYWSALSTITVIGEPVEVISARGLADDRIGSTEVFLAEQGVTGMPGVTPHEYPGADEYPNPPMAAEGYTIYASDEPAIVYIKAHVGPGFSMAHIYGAELQVRTAAGDIEQLVVLSPVTLCAGDNDQDCSAEQRRLRDIVERR